MIPGPRVGDLAALTEAFSAAAIDPTLWVAAMDVAARVTGSVGSGLLPLKGHLPNVPISQSVGELFETYFRDGWHRRDERYRGVPILMQRGVMSDLDFAHPDEFARSSYYQELFAPFGMQWFVGVKVAAGDDIWCLAIQRSIQQGPFPSADLQKLGSLSQQLSSAAALARSIGFARAEAASDAFEVSGSPVVMLDRRGEVLRVNTAAEKILCSLDLRIVKGRLASWDGQATAALDRAVNALIWQKEVSSLLSPIVFPRRQGRPILGYPSRLTGVAVDCFSPCQVAVVLADLQNRTLPGQQRSPSQGGARPDLLMRIFELSPAEARVADIVAEGFSVGQAADVLGIAVETARNQLKGVFAKTQTHRQGELVALLSRLAV
jgi:DNA-binding CsgD family transcriptional regulator